MVTFAVRCGSGSTKSSGRILQSGVRHSTSGYALSSTRSAIHAAVKDFDVLAQSKRVSAVQTSPFRSATP